MEEFANPSLINTGLISEVELRDNFRCKYPASIPIPCNLEKNNMCSNTCANYGVCAVCHYNSLSIVNNECFECHHYTGKRDDIMNIARDKKAEADMVKAIKEKDGYLNGNNVKL